MQVALAGVPHRFQNSPCLHPGQGQAMSRALLLKNLAPMSSRGMPALGPTLSHKSHVVAGLRFRARRQPSKVQSSWHTVCLNE